MTCRSVWRSITARVTVTTAPSRFHRTSSGCDRRRIAGRDHSYSLHVKPEKQFINWQQDPYGNYLARFVFPDKSEELSLEVDLVAEMTVINPFDFLLGQRRRAVIRFLTIAAATELAPFLITQPLGPRLAELLETVPRNVRRTVDFLVDLNG